MSSPFRAEAPLPYPVEIDLPDLSEHARGNMGIPYIYTFESVIPGPHVMINALTHGNEVSGAIVLKDLLNVKLRPRVGRLTLSFANVEAYLRFDPAHPDRSRFVDQDFNRVWDPVSLDDMSLNSSELRRARAMRPVIDQVDLLLDLHSMHERSEPLVVAGPLDKAADLGRALGVPKTVIRDEGHSDGCRIRDYGGFGDRESQKNALVVESGQHWEMSSVDIARAATARFLELAGVIEKSDLDDLWWAASPSRPLSRTIQVTDAVVATSVNFSFAGAYTGLERVARAGTVIGWQDEIPIRTPYDDCFLVMPSVRQLRPGVTVVRLGHLEH